MWVDIIRSAGPRHEERAEERWAPLHPLFWTRNSRLHLDIRTPPSLAPALPGVSRFSSLLLGVRVKPLAPGSQEQGTCLSRTCGFPGFCSSSWVFSASVTT